MRKLLSIILAVVMTVSCLSGAVFAIDPIAEVTNNGKTSKVYSIDDLCAAIDPSGNTKVKVLSRVERIVTDASGQIVFPYTCEIDLNGQTWTNVKSKSGNVLKFNAAGSENSHAIVKNGIILGASVGVSIMEGSIEIRDCTIISPKSIGVSMYSTETKYNDKNLIDGCYILAGGANGGISFQGTEPMNGVKMKIQNTTIAQVNGAGYTLNNKAGGVPIIELGENVDLYAIDEATLKEENIVLEGKELMPVDGTFTVSAVGDGVTYSFEGLKKWTTVGEPKLTDLTVTPSDNGAVTLPEGPFYTGDSVTVTVDASEGYVFTHLLVNGIRVDSLTFTVPYSDHVTVQGVFAAKVAIPVTVAASDNGTVTLPEGPFCTGDTVTVTAEADEGYKFSHLLVNGFRVDGLTFTVPEANAVTVHGVFGKTVSVTVAASQNGVILLSAAEAAAGSTVTVTAEADEGCKFSHLTVNGVRVYGLSFTVPDDIAVVVTGVFVKEGTSTPVEPLPPTPPVQPDPNVPAGSIARIVTESTTVYVSNVEDMVAAISSGGTSTVTLLQDVEHTDQVKLPVCILDLNGHTWSTKDAARNAIYFDGRELTAADAANLTSVVKNGTIDAGRTAISTNVGALTVQNATLIANAEIPAVQLLSGATNSLSEGKWNDANLMENCTVYCATGPICRYNSDNIDFSKVKFTIKNSTLVSESETTPLLMCREGVSAPGSFEIGESVNFYHKAANAVVQSGTVAPVISGKTIVKADGTRSVTVAGVTYEGLTLSFTDGPIAKVVTDGKSVEVATVDQLAAAIDPSGKSVVTLLKDVNVGETTINLEYSCTIDLAGHRLSNTKSNLLNIKGVGSENKITTVKNGTLNGKMSAITWRKGGLVVEGCTLLGQGSAAIQIVNHTNSDPDASNYKDVNVIRNSTLCSPIWVALSFNSKSHDFSAVTLTIENSNLVSPKESGTQVLGMQSEAVSGTFVLGKGVNMYTYKFGETDYMMSGVNVTGEPVTKAAELSTATVDGKTYAGFTVFSTPAYTKAALTVLASENGTVTLPVTEAEYGTEVTAAAAAAEGYCFCHLLVNGVKVEGLTFTVPEAETVTVQGVFEVDPASPYLFEVINGSDAHLVTDVAELNNADLIRADGTTIVRMLKDVATTGRVTLPNPCTVDLNGHTLTIQKDDGTLAGNGIQFTEKETATNATSTVKNGTINCGVIGVRVSKNAGGIILEDLVIRTAGGTCLGVYHADSNNTNIIRNCTLYSEIWAGVAFYNEDFKAVGTKVVIENTTIVCPKEAGANIFDRNDLIKDDGITGSGGIIELGYGVKLYNTRDVFVLSNETAPVMAGIPAVQKVSNKTASFQLGALSATGLNLWETGEKIVVQNAVLTAVASENGTVTLPFGEAAVGSSVTVGAVPAEGYEFSHLLVNGEKVEGLTFTVPEAETVTVQGVFVKKPVITLTGGTLKRGETLVVPVVIKDNPTIGAANIHVVYDETALKLESIAGFYADPENGMQMGMVSAVVNPAANAIAFAEASGISTDGGLLWLTFSAREGGADGKYSVTLEKLPNTSALFIGTDGSHLDIAIESATITLKTVKEPVDPNSAHLAVGSATAYPGGTVTVPVYLRNNPGVAGVMVELTYGDGLTLEKVELGDAVPGLDFTMPGDLTANPVTLSWDGMDADSTSGLLVNLTFRVDENAAEGDRDIILNYGPGSIYDDDLQDLDFGIIDGVITVKNYIPGDINGDWIVTNKDVTMLRRYISGGYDVTGFVEAALDVNRDGIVTNKDVTLLRRFISGGYGVELS